MAPAHGSDRLGEPRGPGGPAQAVTLPTYASCPCTLELPPPRGSFGEGHVVEPQPGKPFTGVYFLEAKEGTCVGIGASVLRDGGIGASVVRDMAWPADSGFRASVLTDTAHPQASALQASPCQLGVRAHGGRRLEARPPAAGVCGAGRGPAGGGVGGRGKVLGPGRVSERRQQPGAPLDSTAGPAAAPGGGGTAGGFGRLFPAPHGLR